MLLQQDIGGGNSNGFPPGYQLVPRKDGSHISNNRPQIPPDRVRGGGGRHGGGARTSGISGTGLLQTRVGFAHKTDGMIPSS